MTGSFVVRVDNTGSEMTFNKVHLEFRSDVGTRCTVRLRLLGNTAAATGLNARINRVSFS